MTIGFLYILTIPATCSVVRLQEFSYSFLWFFPILCAGLYLYVWSRCVCVCLFEHWKWEKDRRYYSYYYLSNFSSSCCCWCSDLFWIFFFHPCLFFLTRSRFLSIVYTSVSFQILLGGSKEEKKKEVASSESTDWGVRLSTLLLTCVGTWKRRAHTHTHTDRR